MRSSFKRNPKKFILIPLCGIAVLALISYIVMQLWNNLLPDIFHVTTINYWQAMGIFILCKILFGFGGKGGRGGAPWMRHRMEERLKGMSSEDKERFKAQWEKRCSWGNRNNWHSKEQPHEQHEAKAEEL
jgi:hypothetical protein